MLGGFDMVRRLRLKKPFRTRLSKPVVCGCFIADGMLSLKVFARRFSSTLKRISNSLFAPFSCFIYPRSASDFSAYPRATSNALSKRLRQFTPKHKTLFQTQSLAHRCLNQRGFSLLELSIALVIMTILSVGVSQSIAVSRDADRYADNRLLLQAHYAAFMTFAQVNGYLPCPDTDGDGLENRKASYPFQCVHKKGQVPYRELGIAFGDVWGQPLRYSVNSVAANSTAKIIDPTESASYFSQQPPPLRFNLETPPYGSKTGSGNYTVCNEFAGTACHSGTPTSGRSGFSVIAVVVSYGKNGAQTWAGNATSAAEALNSSNKNYFWQAARSQVPGQEFDDQLFWITGYDLKFALLTSASDVSVGGL